MRAANRNDSALLPMPSLRIAAAQCVSVPGDMAANITAHCNFIVEASNCGVDIVVFPELSLCGYELPLIGACALRPDDELLAPLRALARSRSMSVLVGAPILSASNEVHIGAITFFSDGASSVYCKHHLHAGEERYAKACAAPYRTYQVGGEAIALAICADTAHEQHPRAAAAIGASLYLASVLVSDAAYASDAGKLQHYAERYRMATLMANHGGPSGGYVSAGKSAFWSPEGRLLIAAPGAGQYLVIASKKSGEWAGELRKIPTQAGT